MVLTPTSAAGSKRGGQGFTLIEMLVVLVIVAVATVGVQMGMSRQESGLVREAEQLSAWIEVMRADARANGTTLQLRFGETGVTAQAQGLPDRTHAWINTTTRARVALTNGQSTPTLDLPAEPVIGPTTLTLNQGRSVIQLHTDGLAAMVPATP